MELLTELQSLKNVPDWIDSAQSSNSRLAVNGEEKAQIHTNAANITTINSLISEDATTSNKLIDKQYVDDKVLEMSAHYITSNAQGDPFTSHQALLTGPYYYAGEAFTPTEHDYAIVSVDETHDNDTTRYTRVSSTWSFQYKVISGTIYDSTITLQKNSTTIDSFTLNQSTGKTINITVPTSTEDITNDSGFITAHDKVDNATNADEATKVSNSLTLQRNGVEYRTFDGEDAVVANERTYIGETAPTTGDYDLWVKPGTELLNFQTDINQSTVPTASTSDLGMVMVDGETITIDEDGIIHGATQITPATSAALGGVKVAEGSGLEMGGTNNEYISVKIDNETILIDEDTGELKSKGGVDADPLGESAAGPIVFEPIIYNEQSESINDTYSCDYINNHSSKVYVVDEENEDEANLEVIQAWWDSHDHNSGTGTYITDYPENTVDLYIKKTSEYKLEHCANIRIYKSSKYVECICETDTSITSTGLTLTAGHIDTENKRLYLTIYFTDTTLAEVSSFSLTKQTMTGGYYSLYNEYNNSSGNTYSTRYINDNMAKIWDGTLAEYNAITTKDPMTVYLIHD